MNLTTNYKLIFANEGKGLIEVFAKPLLWDIKDPEIGEKLSGSLSRLLNYHYTIYPVKDVINIRGQSDDIGSSLNSNNFKNTYKIINNTTVQFRIKDLLNEFIRLNLFWLDHKLQFLAEENFIDWIKRTWNTWCYISETLSYGLTVRFPIGSDYINSIDIPINIIRDSLVDLGLYCEILSEKTIRMKW